MTLKDDKLTLKTPWLDSQTMMLLLSSPTETPSPPFETSIAFICESYQRNVCSVHKMSLPHDRIISWVQGDAKPLSNGCYWKRRMAWWLWRLARKYFWRSKQTPWPFLVERLGWHRHRLRWLLSRVCPPRKPASRADPFRHVSLGCKSNGLT